ncbi:glycosyltransferase involved in cell wall biosynthesis [Oribacterium sinus]|uniref:Glycosyltransferase involved in cell wall biosynthesis n=1 Tax=Oribacterium sinus TaxID=237576 RepID=A0A7W9W1T1_9FIRM|nr:glycosyltransferase family 4 protein [Oribacterium sinus]MBB6040532.1 glycosyltransferase involved in cell wall biosynthesis [Oribacterium sinus]
MEKRVLILASVASMIGQFNRDNISLLQEMGYKIDVACNFKNGSTFSEESAKQLKKELIEQGVRCFHVDFSRSPVQIGKHVQCYRTVKRLMIENQYLFCHCHSPIGGAIARIAGHATKTKIIYTAHGFHFFKGASILNWAIYYPIELLLSYWTNCLITINKEDYYRAKYKFHAKKTVYIPGVGIDSNRFQNLGISREQKRQELGLSKENIFILSVGELNKNKNHEVVVRALAGLKGQNIVYMIAGEGNQKEHLRTLAEENGVSLRLLGFREDICSLLEAADVFAFPSKREGLSVSVMEAMFMKKPVIASKIRGNTDLIKDGENGLLVYPNTAKAWEQGLYEMLNTMNSYRLGEKKRLEPLEKNSIHEKMICIYQKVNNN